MFQSILMLLLSTGCQGGDEPQDTETPVETGETGETGEDLRLDPRLCLTWDTYVDNESSATVDDEPARLYLDYGDDRAYHACPGLLTENALHTLKIVRDGKEHVFEVETGPHPTDWALPDQPIAFKDLLRNGTYGSMYIEQIELLDFELALTGTQSSPSASLINVDGTWPSTALEISDVGEFTAQFSPSWFITGLGDVYEYKSSMTLTGFLNADGSIATAWLDIRFEEHPDASALLPAADEVGRYTCDEGVCFDGSFLRPPR